MPLIDREDSLLLVIDVQTNFYPKERLDVDRAEFDVVAERISWIAAVAGASDVPVIVTEEDPAKNSETVEVIQKALSASARTFPKHAFGVCENPDIAQGIESTQRHTVILSGLETDVCIAHSAIQLTDLGKRVVLLRDATYSPGAAHSAGLKRLAALGVEVISTKELYYDWFRSISDTRRFRDSNRHLATPPESIIL